MPSVASWTVLSAFFILCIHASAEEEMLAALPVCSPEYATKPSAGGSSVELLASPVCAVEQTEDTSCSPNGGWHGFPSSHEALLGKFDEETAAPPSRTLCLVENCTSRAHEMETITEATRARRRLYRLDAEPACSIPRIDFEKFEYIAIAVSIAQRAGQLEATSGAQSAGKETIFSQFAAITGSSSPLVDRWTKPFVLRPKPGSPRCAAYASFASDCSRHQLIERYGSTSVLLSTANTHSYDKHARPFSAYVSSMLAPQDANVPGKDSLYLFGDNDWNEWSWLASRFQQPLNLTAYTNAGSALSFGVAGSGTGVPLHTHGPVFAETVFGFKKWFLYPPEGKPHFDPDANVLQWLQDRNVAGDTDIPEFECTLAPGETIFIPSQYWHSTLNIGQTVFMSTFV